MAGIASCKNICLVNFAYFCGFGWMFSAIGRCSVLKKVHILIIMLGYQRKFINEEFFSYLR